jgi:hypothetical protein
VLHIKLARTAKSLRDWAKTLIPYGKLVSTIYGEVIDQLEVAQESRMRIGKKPCQAPEAKDLGPGCHPEEQGKTKIQIDMAEVGRCKHKVLPFDGQC